MNTRDTFELDGVKLCRKIVDNFDCEGCYFEVGDEFDCRSLMDQKIIPTCTGSEIVIFIEVKA